MIVTQPSPSDSSQDIDAHTTLDHSEFNKLLPADQVYIPGTDHCLVHKNSDYQFVSSVNTVDFKTSTLYVVDLDFFKVIRSLPMSSLILTVETVPADDKFGHSGFILISLASKKLAIYSLEDFTMIKTLNASSTVYAIHAPDPETIENSTSKFLAVCCASAGKTGNLKVIQRSKGLDFDFQLLVFDCTSKPVTQVVPSTSFRGQILGFNSGGRNLFFYDYRKEVLEPGRRGEPLVGKLEDEKSLTLIKEVDPDIWLVHLGAE